jgi:hypothetical protein
VDDEIKKKVMSDIKTLGGEITSHNSNEHKYWTHIIVGDISANSNKLLSSIASKKWILDVTYINDSINEKKFLNESEYEIFNLKKKKNNFDLGILKGKDI